MIKFNKPNDDVTMEDCIPVILDYMKDKQKFNTGYQMQLMGYIAQNWPEVIEELFHKDIVDNVFPRTCVMY